MLISSSVICFLETVRLGSITRTADQLYLSRQAVSKHILRLEEELGTSLFDRSRGKLFLTPAGQRYYNFFTEMMEKWQALRDELREAEPAPAALRVGFVKGMNIEQEVYALIDRCTADEPGLTLLWERLETAELAERLKQNQLDLIFTFGRVLGTGGEIEHIPFLPSEFCLVAGESYRKMPAILAGQYSACTFLTWKLAHLPDAIASDDFRLLCADFGIRPREVVLLPNLESVQTAVQMGSGVTISVTQDRMCSARGVKAFPLGVASDFHIAWRAEEQDPTLKKLIGRIRAELEQPNI